MDAKGIYQLVLSTYPTTGEFSVCDLHKPCKSTHRCAIVVPSNLIDFDKVEIEVDKGKNSRPSVDAIAAAGNKFCFIELKGWAEYLKWNTPTEEDIKQQASYNLLGKYETSKEICKSIAGDTAVFDSIPEVFVLVTDIDVQTQGIENFQFNLMALAVTGSDWQTFCNKSLSEELNKQITTVPKFYVDCKHLMSKLREIETI